jgi:hypothetical protein
MKHTSLGREPASKNRNLVPPADSSANDAYVSGFQAARKEGPYSDPQADTRCPFETGSREADEWRRGFDDASRAQDASG